MRNLLSLLLLTVSVQVFAQSYPITGITISLPANPDASTTKWATGTSMLTITATGKLVNGRIDTRLEASKILVTIKKGGAKTCGAYIPASAPSANFNAATKVWSGNNAVSLLGQDCTLTPGDYELCVQFFGQGPTGLAPLSEEKCKSFTIADEKQQSYNPPVNMAPVDKKVFNEREIKAPVVFRWLGVMPKPRESVTYRLRVWQLTQGQTGTQAMKSNQPLVDKNVKDQTQTIINNIIDGPCKPPYLCDFVWNVQALNREGKPIGDNNGISEPFLIIVTPINDPPSVIHLISPENKSTVAVNKGIRFTWSHEMQQTGPPSIYRIRIVEIKSDQSPEQAMGRNKPFFEKDSLNERMFFWPALADSKSLPGRFAWQITGYRNPAYGEVKPTKSEIYEFRGGKEQRGPGFPTERTDAFCTDFENGDPNGWLGQNTIINTISSGGNPGQYIETEDVSGTSSFNNTSTAYTGDWSELLVNGCGSLCFDIKYILNTIPPLTMTPSITIEGNGFIASFVTNATITVGDGWHSYCAPLKYLNADGTLPSNSNGHWVMAGTGTAADWNTLLANVDKVRLPTDVVSYSGEKFGYDNICIKNTGDCGSVPIVSCLSCDSITINASNQSIVNLSAVTGSVKVQNYISTTSVITKIVADLVCVIIKPANSNCNVCNKEKNQQDHFSGTSRITTPGWTMNGKGEIAQQSVNAITRSLTFTSSSIAGVNLSGGIVINHELGIAPTSCCGDKIEVWIRYTLWDRGCHVCDKLVKATLDRPGTCSTGTNDDHH